jgi:phosphate transport system ATP-binding protein
LVPDEMTAGLSERRRQAEAGLAKVEVQRFNASFGLKTILTDIDMKVPPQRVTAIIGPSGSGKSTLLRCINRMHELVPGSGTTGKILLDGDDVYAPGIDAVDVRRKIGMVFQKPNPFPHMTIRDNVVAGLKLDGVRDKNRLDAVARKSLESAFLWDEVKDELSRSGARLSGGQQQRLCIARAVAVEPEVLLMDEPCSALDPIATSKIEELIVKLKERYTVLIVTHNLQQAARVADYVAFLYLGRLIEFGPIEQMFGKPREELTERYVTGRFG